MMKTEGVQVIKKLNVLLAVLLCCMFALNAPDTLQAASIADEAQESQQKLTRQAQTILIAGEMAAVEVKAILPLEKPTLGIFLHQLWQRLHLQTAAIASVCHLAHAFKGDTGLHVIFTQGP